MVSLLPSGPEPVSTVKSLDSLRNLDPSPLVSQDKASQLELSGSGRIAKAVPVIRPPHDGGFGLQVTPNHPG